MPLNQDDNQKDHLANTAFISEKIKQRPINRKKLIRRTLITISLAVIFGGVACFTFLFLQPVFSDTLYPEKEPEAVSFPAESASDELTPEEMYADDNEIAATEIQNLEATQKDQIDQAIASYSFDSADYEKMITSLRQVTTSVEKNIVKVTVDGPARLVGVDNGDSTDYDEYKGDSSFQGALDLLKQAPLSDPYREEFFSLVKIAQRNEALK